MYGNTNLYDTLVGFLPRSLEELAAKKSFRGELAAAGQTRGWHMLLKDRRISILAPDKSSVYSRSIENVREWGTGWALVTGTSTSI
jgi:hypothetical protein